MSDTLVAVPLALLERMTCALERLAVAPVSPALSEEGLLDYAAVAARLSAAGRKKMSIRQVCRLQKKHPSILRKVMLGSRTVRFRPADVDKLLSQLAGEEKPWGRKL